jgi:3-isopropylmalate dehydratase small subunit
MEIQGKRSLGRMIETDENIAVGSSLIHAPWYLRNIEICGGNFST